MQTGVFLDLGQWAFWRCTPALHRRLFVDDVHGGTLVYRRTCLESRAKYPDHSLAEDATFLRTAMRKGARLKRIPNDGSFLYLRHGGNASSLPCGTYLDPRGWYTVPEPELPAEDRAFYMSLFAAFPRLPSSGPSFSVVANPPLVSCIMPTSDRRALVAQSIRYFLGQDYPNRELIIVDDGADPVADLIPEDPRIDYVQLRGRSTIGDKRNLACERAKGTIIAHWDDDDWSAAWRLSYQVNALTQTPGKGVCGLSTVLYYDPDHDKAWAYEYPAHRRRWVAGNTLCYRKSLWQQHRFPQSNEGEDTQFLWSLPESLILPLSNHRFYVATVHEKNSSPKRTGEPWWRPCSTLEVRAIIGSDFRFYENWPAELFSAAVHGTL